MSWSTVQLSSRLLFCAQKLRATWQLEDSSVYNIDVCPTATAARAPRFDVSDRRLSKRVNTVIKWPREESHCQSGGRSRDGRPKVGGNVWQLGMTADFGGV